MAQKAPKFPVGLFAYNDFRRSPATKMERIPFPRIPQNLKLLDKIPANIELIASLSEVQNRPEFRTRSFFFSLSSRSHRKVSCGIPGALSLSISWPTHLQPLSYKLRPRSPLYQTLSAKHSTDYVKRLMKEWKTAYRINETPQENGLIDRQFLGITSFRAF